LQNLASAALSVPHFVQRIAFSYRESNRLLFITKAFASGRQADCACVINSQPVGCSIRYGCRSKRARVF
jgi:hypothetical protein